MRPGCCSAIPSVSATLTVSGHQDSVQLQFMRRLEWADGGHARPVVMEQYPARLDPDHLQGKLDAIAERRARSEITLSRRFGPTDADRAWSQQNCVRRQSTGASSPSDLESRPTFLVASHNRVYEDFVEEPPKLRAATTPTRQRHRGRRSQVQETQVHLGGAAGSVSASTRGHDICNFYGNDLEDSVRQEVSVAGSDWHESCRTLPTRGEKRRARIKTPLVVYDVAKGAKVAAASAQFLRPHTRAALELTQISSHALRNDWYLTYTRTHS